MELAKDLLWALHIKGKKLLFVDHVHNFATDARGLFDQLFTSRALQKQKQGIVKAKSSSWLHQTSRRQILHLFIALDAYFNYG